MKMEHLHPFPLEPCHSAPVFSSPYWKTKKTCQGTNLESLECQSTPGLFTVLFGKKKNNS